jgi:hypothetical protein
LEINKNLKGLFDFEIGWQIALLNNFSQALANTNSSDHDSYYVQIYFMQQKGSS